MNALKLIYVNKFVQGKINKSTRKFMAGTCLLLAIKFTSDVKRHYIKNMIEVSSPK